MNPGQTKTRRGVEAMEGKLRAALARLNIPDEPPPLGSSEAAVAPQRGSVRHLVSVFSGVFALSRRLWVRQTRSGRTDGEGQGKTLALLVFLNVALLAGNTAMSLWFSYVIRGFTTALQEKKEKAFWDALWSVMLVVSLCVPLDALQKYCSESLSQLLRKRFTETLFREYFASRSFYHLKQVPNAGVRAMEVDGWISSSLSLIMTFLQHLMNLVAFSGLMMFLSRRLFLALFVYSFFGTYVMVWLFFPKVTRLSVLMTGAMQTIRHSLVRVHENRESVAFMRGGRFECTFVQQQFSALMDLAARALQWSIALSSFQQVFEYATIVLPYLVIAPLYFSGEVEYGVVSQSSMAFYRVKMAMNVIVSQFNTLSSLAGTTQRIRLLVDGLEACHEQDMLLRKREEVQGCHMNRCVDESRGRIALSVENLEVRTPVASKDALTTTCKEGNVLCRGLHFKLPQGQALLISGTSGCGKSSLLRVFSQLWPAFDGKVWLQARDLVQSEIEHAETPNRIAFLPQSAYFPKGTLREALCYPMGTNGNPAFFSLAQDTRLLQCLADAQLGDLASRVGGLDAINIVWSDMLSHGEQQRLAFARVFFQRPEICFADEATSAIDAESESALYGRLREIVPTVVSVGHRKSLRQHHEWCLKCVDGGEDTRSWSFGAMSG